MAGGPVAARCWALIPTSLSQLHPRRPCRSPQVGQDNYAARSNVSLRILHLIRREVVVPVGGVEPPSYPVPAGGPGRIRTDDIGFADRRLSSWLRGLGRRDKNRTRSAGFGGQLVTITLTPWLGGKDSNLRDLGQSQADYRYLTSHCSYCAPRTIWFGNGS